MEREKRRVDRVSSGVTISNLIGGRIVVSYINDTYCVVLPPLYLLINYEI